MATLTYKDAGVDTEAQGDFTREIGRMVSSNRSSEVVAGIGGFASAFAPNITGMTRPLLISGTDGVGTKLKLAFATGMHDTVGIDLVAMCVNDVLTTGARPLFFLDYFATGRLEKEVHLRVVRGVVEGCRLAECALVGGETAELPGMYAPGEYDLAGFSVGLVDEPKMITGKSAKPGDVLVGLPSSGVHSNGFSLVRTVLHRQGFDLDRTYEGFDRPLGEVVMTPTRIYVKTILGLIEKVEVKALAHITGGGIVENLPRVLPENCHAVIDRSAIPTLPIFPFIAGAGVESNEMWSVFNMGVGMILVLDSSNVDEVVRVLKAEGENPFIMGQLADGPGEVTFR